MEKNNDEKDEEYNYRNMDNYIKNELSVCREERQYALYLYNILLKCKYCKGIFKDAYKDILKKCGFELNDSIKDVFYEAAFMRDFFKRDKRCAYVNKNSLGNKLLNIDCSEEKHKYPYEKDTYKARFNYCLLEYLFRENKNVLEDIIGYEKKEYDKNKSIDSILDLNLGGKVGRACVDKIIREIKKGDEIKEEMKKAQILMNVKPDIAVIFEREEKLRLKFLEGKFESSEDKYDGFMTQTEAQGLVGKFLCESSLKIKYDQRDIDWDEAKLVYFRRNSQKNQKKDEQSKIQIDKLIKLNNDIFLGF